MKEEKHVSGVPLQQFLRKVHLLVRLGMPPSGLT